MTLTAAYLFPHPLCRDLKPENILYQGPEDDSPLKLADFGLAALLKPNQLMTVACGTPGYVAPEILRGMAYGKEVDIWSIGVILYILLCGFPPFYDDNNKKLFAQIVNANYSFPDPYWTNISAHAKELVTKLLVIDPSRRLSADQILQHPWMAEDGTSLPLDHFKTNLKSYNARRRFRSAIRAVQITQLLRNMTKAGNSQPPSIMAVIESSGNPPSSHVHGTVTDDEDSDAELSSRSNDSNRSAGISTVRRKSKDGENPNNVVGLEKIPELLTESSVKAGEMPAVQVVVDSTTITNNVSPSKSTSSHPSNAVQKVSGDHHSGQHHSSPSSSTDKTHSATTNRRKSK